MDRQQTTAEKLRIRLTLKASTLLCRRIVTYVPCSRRVNNSHTSVIRSDTGNKQGCFVCHTHAVDKITISSFAEWLFVPCIPQTYDNLITCTWNLATPRCNVIVCMLVFSVQSEKCQSVQKTDYYAAVENARNPQYKTVCMDRDDFQDFNGLTQRTVRSTTKDTDKSEVNWLTRNRKHRQAASKPAACAKPLMLSTLGRKGKRVR